jgi:phage shock protein PspC (stress-responsive transcriptional regulator)
MNKVVNINLNGIVLSIDESAYEQLKQYIEKLKIHFSFTENGEDIIQDIEARIAELLQLKLSDRYTVVQQIDVNEVITLMGDPTEIEVEENPQQEKEQHASGHKIKQLKRDTHHKTIGGVCSGLANYFGIDIMIPRILFLIAFFVFGSGLLVYIIMWIVIPESSISENFYMNKNRKRLFRNPDDKRIGGVCSGVAEYLAIDSVWLRLGFLATFFIVGSGLFVYIILWIALPEAKTSSEKLQMKGESIDVNNIEKQVRSNSYKTTIASTQSSISQLLRFFYKIISTVLGSVLLIIAIVLIGVVIFIWNNSFSSILDRLDINAYYSYFQYGFALFCFSFATLILILGIKLIFHSRIKVKVISIILTLCILVGLFLMLRFGWQYRNSVSSKNLVKELAFDEKCPDTLFIKVENTFAEDEELGDIDINKSTKGTEFKISKMGEWVRVFYNTKLSIKQSKNENMQLYLVKSARGENSVSALQNANAIIYNTSLTNKLLMIDDGIRVDKNKVFKYQQVSAKLRVPIGTIIKVDKNAMKMINEAYEEEFDLGETFQMTTKGLHCLDCLDTEDIEDENVNIEWNVDEDDGEVNIKIKKEALKMQEDSFKNNPTENSSVLKKPTKSNQ